MSRYNDNITFKTDKKDDSSSKALKRFLFFGLGIIVIIIILIIVILSLVNKNIDTSLSSLSVDSGIISPEFKSNKLNYTIETDSDDLFFTCKASSKKSKIDGCGKTIKLEDEENDIRIVVSHKKQSTTYNFKVIKNSKFDIQVTGNSDNWTDKDITLMVTATSLENIPLADLAYSFDDGETWQKENKAVFSKNQTVKIRVKDIEGNTSAAYKEKITKIDKNVPKVKLSVNKKKLTAVVTPEKTPSGYSYTWYLNGKEIEGAKSINYTAKENGKYKVKVTSKVGKSVESEEVNITNGTTYTINYNGNGGVDVPNDQIKSKDEELIITSKTPSREGYYFKGWSVTSDGEVDYVGGDKYNLNKAITLYAVWEKITSVEKYNIYYDATGGSNAPSAQVKEQNKDITISNTIPTKADSEFLGWAVTNGGSVVYTPGAVYKDNKSITLYAVWKKMKTITVTYRGNGANVTKSSVSSSGTNTFTMPTITRNGYTVVGWAYSQTATQANYAVGQKVTFNDSVTLYAVTYKNITATFNKNTASKISKTSESCYLYNKATLCSVTTPTITPKSGKKALGWSMYPNVSNASFGVNTKVAISSNTTLYAITK